MTFVRRGVGLVVLGAVVLVAACGGVSEDSVDQTSPGASAGGSGGGGSSGGPGGASSAGSSGAAGTSGTAGASGSGGSTAGKGGTSSAGTSGAAGSGGGTSGTSGAGAAGASAGAGGSGKGGGASGQGSGASGQGGGGTNGSSGAGAGGKSGGGSGGAGTSGGAGAAGGGGAGPECLSDGPFADVYGMGGVSCFAASDCAPSLYCIGNTLVTNTTMCVGHTCDYSAGKLVMECPGTCAQGACVDPCGTDSDCGKPRYRCLQGQRVVYTPLCGGGACDEIGNPAPCDTGTTCVGDVCVPVVDDLPVVACSVALDCPIPAGTCTCATTMEGFGAPSCVAGKCVWERYTAYCSDGCKPGVCQQGLL